MDKQNFITWAKKLESTYQANEEVRSSLSKIDLIAIVGPTGVGKTTIIDSLGLPYVKSDVTRAKRPGEKKDKNYHFRDDYLEMLKEIKDGKYVQFVVSGSGEFYGTRASSYPKQGACTMAILAHAIPDFQKMGFNRVLPVFIMPPGYVEWMRRIGNIRSGDINERITEAIKSMNIAIRDDHFKFVLNDSLDLAINDIKKIIAGEPVDNHRTLLARETADVLLEKLGDQNDDVYFENE